MNDDLEILIESMRDMSKADIDLSRHSFPSAEWDVAKNLLNDAANAFALRLDAYVSEKVRKELHANANPEGKGSVRRVLLGLRQMSNKESQLTPNQRALVDLAYTVMHKQALQINAMRDALERIAGMQAPAECDGIAISALGEAGLL